LQHATVLTERELLGHVPSQHIIISNISSSSSIQRKITKCSQYSSKCLLYKYTNKRGQNHLKVNFNDLTICGLNPLSKLTEQNAMKKEKLLLKKTRGGIRYEKSSFE